MRIEKIAQEEIHLFERPSVKTSKALALEVTHLRWLLGKAWGAIQEAGYEGCDFELRGKIEKAL